MPGFAITSSISNEGQAKGAFVKDVGGTSPSLLFTATKKTRVISCSAVNKSGGILPINLFVRKAGVDTELVRARVHKRKHLILSLVEQDARIGADKMADLPHTEVVLLPGESLYATAPIEDAFDITLSVFEGIS